MEKHTCKTYFAINLKKDSENKTLLKEIVEKFIQDKLRVEFEWRNNRFVIGYNENYCVDVNDMIRVTLKDLINKIEELRVLGNTFNVTNSLVIVPSIVANSGEPNPILSLDKDIIAFLDKANVSMDLDYYVV